MRRIAALDILRGVAIMGTLGTNIWLFTSPGGPAAQLAASAGGVETFLRFLANGKFLGLLTLLFGVGLELQYRSARRRGARWPGWYLWRAALLCAEGLVHYVLIFEFDVLMGYAVISVAVAYLIGRSDRVTNAWIVMLGSLHVAMMSLVTYAMLTVEVQVSGPATPLYTEGSWLEQVVARIQLAPLYRLESVFIIPMGIVLFLLGARLTRAGAFEDSARGGLLRRRLMAVGLGVALPLNLVTAFAGPEWFFLDRYVLPPVVALGLLGLVTTVITGMRGEGGPARRGLANVGRTALSCYVFQNLAASVVCYGWGLGLASRLDHLRPWWVIAAWAGICVLFMALATLWLRRFERGPLELAWQWAYRLPQRAEDQRAGSAVQGAPPQTFTTTPDRRN
ncbi:DUF418 domain-containing protein [Spongiactinospora sp. TRM90649]|uniref:DUF418 domain-containing protein n=1 Tax=Spongiactinospora sp. TRM90649 TaxID=3031114 RepID=UPI0023F89158|nr:DUF418 domain-containing protein [Spongiactinospora sp. TRM90649]MDF5752750.1 DUF418 domain-containing protein [Spongiactinospora sp. TRM90649]